MAKKTKMIAAAPETLLRKKEKKKIDKARARVRLDARRGDALRPRLASTSVYQRASRLLEYLKYHAS